MTKRAILLVALAVTFVAGLSAQDKPNFAGTWKPVDSFNRTRITVEGSKMTVTITLAGNSDSTVYMLDGTPAKKTFPGPGGKPLEQVYTSRWEGDVLVTTITTPAPNPMIEKRWLDADGTMKVERTVILKDKPETGTQVFKKIGSSPLAGRSRSSDDDACDHGGLRSPARRARRRDVGRPLVDPPNARRLSGAPK